LVAALLAAAAVVLLHGCGGGGEEEKKEAVLDNHIRSFLDEKPGEAVLYMVCIETVDLSIEKIRNSTQHKLEKECKELTDKIENLPEGKHVVDKKCQHYGNKYMGEAVNETQGPLRKNCTTWGKSQISNKLSNSSSPKLENILEVAHQCFENFEEDHPKSIQFAQYIFDTKVEKARERTTALITKLKEAARETMKKQLADLGDEDEAGEKFDLAAPTAKDLAVPAVNMSFFPAAVAGFGLVAFAGSTALVVLRRTRGQRHISRVAGGLDSPDASDNDDNMELTGLRSLSNPLANAWVAE